MLLIWVDSHSLPWAEGFQCLGPEFQRGLFMLLLNLLSKTLIITPGICLDWRFGFPFYHDMHPSPETKKVNLKCQKHQRVSQSIVTGKVSSFWTQDQQQPVPQVGHHFSQRFCGSGKSSRNHSVGPGLATGQLCDLETSASPLGPSVLSTRWRVRWGDLSRLLALILWSPWVFLTLKPHHHKRSKDERLSAHGGQITSLKANASKHEAELTVTVASEFFKMSWSSESVAIMWGQWQ